MGKHIDHRKVDVDGPVSSSRPVLTFRMGLATVRKEVEAVPEATCAVINLDIPGAVTTVLGHQSQWKPYCERMAGLPEFDIRAASLCETYALAAGWAHTLSLAASTPPEAIDALVAEVAALKVVVLADLEAAAARGILDGTRLDNLRGTSGRMKLGFDMLLLIGISYDNWAGIHHHSSITRAELERAEVLAQRLVAVVGEEDGKAQGVVAAELLRRQAFTLFVRSWDLVRRGISFLRWAEGDVDTIAPSLYAGRTSPKKEAADDGTAESTAAPTGTATAPATGGGGGGSTAATSNPLIVPGPAGGASASTSTLPASVLAMLGPSTPFGK